jgi:hypothetical protein
MASRERGGTAREISRAQLASWKAIVGFLEETLKRR